MNEAMESNYEEYRPWYRPISTGSGVTTTDTEVVTAETERKGICLCKQETHVEDSSRTIVTFFFYLFTNNLGFNLGFKVNNYW
jgi:hypothetical protein